MLPKTQRQSTPKTAPERMRCMTKMFRSGKDSRQHLYLLLVTMPTPQTIAYMCRRIARIPQANSYIELRMLEGLKE